MLNTNYRNVLTSAGGTTFAYTFQIYANSDIQVVVANSDGSSPSTKLLDTDYTVTGAGSASGGNVVFTSAVTASKKVILTLRPPLTQTLDLTTADALPAESLEAAMNRLASQQNSLAEKVSRCLSLPDSTPAITQPVIPDYNVTTNQSLFLRLGVTGIEVAAAGGGGGVSLTTKGDLLGHNGTSEVRVAVGADYRLLMADSASTPGYKWEDIHNIPGVTGIIGSVTARSNLLQNGAMLVWQRGTSFASTGTSTGLCSADRWRSVKSGTTGAMTASRVTNVPTVVSPETVPLYSLRLACTTADAVVDSTDLVSIRQRVLGGTWRPYAQRPFVISFWCRSNLTGTYAVAINNAAKDRAIVTNFTINAANTWEWKNISISASPSAGTWIYDDSAFALDVDFVLMAGTGLGSTVNNTWTTMAATAAYRTSTTNANFMSSTSNYFELTSVQADVGFAPVSTRTETFQDAYDICRKLYFKTFPYATAPAQNAGTTGAIFFNSPVAASTAFTYYAPHFQQLVQNISGQTTNMYNPSAADGQIRNVTRSASCTASSANTYFGQNSWSLSGTTPVGTVVGDQMAIHLMLDSDFG